MQVQDDAVWPAERREVSVVVCTSGRPAELARCLDAVFTHGDAPGLALEVLTVHAPGDDEAMARVRDEFPQVRIVVAPLRNLALQKNLGARHARHDVIVYLDDDAWPAQGWLGALLDALGNPRVAAVAGEVLNPDGSLQLGRIAIDAFGNTRPIAAEHALVAGEVLHLTGGNVAVRRAALFAVGGHDENFAYHLEDGDLARRLAAAGHELRYAQRARIHHQRAPGPHRRSLHDRDYRTIASNQVYFAFRHVRTARWRLALVPALHQAWKGLRLLGLALRGALPLRALPRCLAGLCAGAVRGHYRGLRAAPILPLPDLPPAAPPAAAPLEAARHA